MITIFRSRATVALLLERKRVEITPSNYLQRCRKHMSVQLLLTLLASAATIYLMGLSFISLGISATLLIFTILSSMYFRRHTKSLAVKGDALILNSFNRRSLVTSLRSVRKIRTRNVLGLHITRLDYNLDGRNRSTLVVNRSWAVPSTPERLLKKAIALSNKERIKKGKS